MQILTNHRPRSHITTTATNDSALWFSITARFPNTVVISYNIGVISSTNDATSDLTTDVGVDIPTNFVDFDKFQIVQLLIRKLHPCTRFYAYDSFKENS